MRIGVSFAAGEGLFFRSLFSRSLTLMTENLGEVVFDCAALLELLRALTWISHSPVCDKARVPHICPVLADVGFH